MMFKKKNSDDIEKKIRFPFFVKLLLTLGVIVIALVIAENYIRVNYNITSVIIEGNVHYSDEEVKDMVFKGKYSTNSLYLSLYYKYKKTLDIPFVETIEVKIEDKNTVRISVYEKTLAGFIEYLGKNIYFDKDGIVVESSEVITEGVPEVIGVDFDYVVLYEKLPVKNEKLFSDVLYITKLINKYNVHARKMYFKPNGEVVLYKDSVTIALGTLDNLDVKIMNLPSFLDKLEGKAGTLRMEKYDETTKKVTFEPEAVKEASNADEAKESLQPEENIIPEDNLPEEADNDDEGIN